MGDLIPGRVFGPLPLPSFKGLEVSLTSIPSFRYELPLMARGLDKLMIHGNVNAYKLVSNIVYGDGHEHRNQR